MDPGQWTAQAVNERLILAFRVLPGRPCMSYGIRMVDGHAPPEAIEAFDWVGRFVPDVTERKALLTWARCRASKESWSERCRLMGWPRQTMEDARERAATRIVTGLAPAGCGPISH